MQAIVTKYLGPTNHKGSRVKATAQAGSLTIEWDDALNSDENHRKCAEALVRRLGWRVPGGFREMYSGVLPDGSHCHVLNR